MFKKIAISGVFASLIFTGCSNTQPSVNKLANTNQINLYNQSLYYPNSMQNSLLKTESFRGSYKYVDSSTYRLNKQKDIIELENIYETVDFRKPIYIDKINFQYNSCKKRGVGTDIGVGIFSLALSPLMLLGKNLGVSPAYDEMHIVDQNGKKSFERDTDNYIGCDFDFKYQGFTDKIKVYFDTMHNTGGKALDIVKKRSHDNYYEVTYIPSEKIRDIVEFNLKNRDKESLNDTLINNVLKSDVSSFEYFKKNKAQYNLSKYSVLNLPANSDILFSVENGQKIMQMGIYKDNKKGLTTTNKFFDLENQSNIELIEEEVRNDEKEKIEENYTEFKDELHGYIYSLIDIWLNTIDLKNVRLGINGKSELNEYGKLRDELLTNFKKYDKESKKFDKELDKELEKRFEYHKKLKQYFSNKSYSRAQNQYKSTMKKAFGRVLEDKVWCKNNVCPSMDAIENVIINEAGKKWYAKSKGLPPYLSFDKFLEDKIVKDRVIEKLTKEIEKKSKIKNIKIHDFDYSFDDFTELRYDLALKYSIEDLKKYYKDNIKNIDLEKTIKAKSWSDFIASNSFKIRLKDICKSDKLTNEIYDKLTNIEKNKNIDLSDLHNLYKKYY